MVKHDTSDIELLRGWLLRWFPQRWAWYIIDDRGQEISAYSLDRKGAETFANAMKSGAVEYQRRMTALESRPASECKHPGCCTCPDMPRCSVCNYTAHDAAHLMDHDRCKGTIVAHGTPVRLTDPVHVVHLAPTERPQPQLATDGGFPRRNRVDLFTPAETAIYTAQHAVEDAGASIALTNACVLLAKAREYVADHVESSS